MNWFTSLPWQSGSENVLAVCRRELSKPVPQAVAALWTQALPPRRVPFADGKVMVIDHDGGKKIFPSNEEEKEKDLGSTSHV